MAQKTFKIGEYAKGGIIKVETSSDVIKIRVINMFGDDGEIASQKTVINELDRKNSTDIERRLTEFLHEITTPYYTGNVMKWIKDKTGLNFFWC